MKNKNRLKTGILSILALFLLVTSSPAAHAHGYPEPTYPEPGWIRYDDVYGEIYYFGDGYHRTTHARNYMGGVSTVDDTQGKGFRFNFTGSKIRLITSMSPEHAKDLTLILDGVEYPYSQFAQINSWQQHSFVKTDLSNGEHSLLVIGKSAGRLALDAVDLDENAKLYYYDGFHPLVIPGDSQVTLSWYPIPRAVSYTIERTNTYTGQVTTVSSAVYGTQFVDTGLENDLQYKYRLYAKVDNHRVIIFSKLYSAIPRKPLPSLLPN
ncbi:hypothetical protein NQ117_09200 [Paenibacillus sp. SC116]|uniref:fibronectin type III domain-containing protein n=1 Tax=Paenibacillus sp. SC116 TaxID=2968986 RepID=UPI00215A10CB|nr:fibronectin type III domain-containing protein [Paenibacillus sp. SC116]MCR8843864.1 hypothetical protein [Paenibacillus sp. SC116]